MTRVLTSSRLRGPARLVLLVIANHESEERGAWPSVDTLARECGMSVRSVQRHVQAAVEAGELEVALAAGPHGTNVYRSLTPRQSDTPDIPSPEVAPERKELEELQSPTGSSVPAVGVVLHPDGPTIGVARTSRRRHPLFDTLAAVNGADPRELTTSAARACGVALAEIRKASPGVTANEIALRAGNYRSHYPDAALTPSALARRWAESANPARARGRDNAAAIAGGFG
jgi:hypothetical protein